MLRSAQHDSLHGRSAQCTKVMWTDLVYLDRDPARGRNLWGGESPVSPLLGGLPANFEYNVKKCRVFIHPDIMQQVLGASYRERIADSIRQFLEERYRIQSNLPH